MFYTIVSTILPVFGVILIGAIMKQTRFLPESFFAQCNRYTFWLGLPALLISKISVSEPAGSQTVKLIILLLSATTIIIITAWLASKLLRLKRPSAAAFIHSSFRGNLAYLGLPVIIYSLEADNIPNLAQASSLAALCMAPMIVFYNVIAIPILQYGGSEKSVSPLKNALESIRNPLVLACLAGILLSSFKITIPGPLSKILDLIAQTALPLALLSIGASLSLTVLKHSSVPAAVSSILKTIAAPAITLLVVKMMNFDPVSARIVMVFMSAPTAVATFIMTEQMKCDAQLASSSIVLSTIISIFTFSLAIILT